MIKLGASVKHKLTPYAGTITSRAVYLNGCVRLQVTSSVLHNGQTVQEWFDEQELEYAGQKAEAEAETKPSGGPHQAPPSRDPVQ